jgi:hypothetical protein
LSVQSYLENDYSIAILKKAKISIHTEMVCYCKNAKLLSRHFLELCAHHRRDVVVAVLTNRKVLADQGTEEILVHLEIGPDPDSGNPAPSYRPGDHLVKTFAPQSKVSIVIP